MMKKTLVALAAVAVTGGAFAQATMTGAVAMAYSTDTSVNGVNTSGFGVGDSEINFAISEDIEGLGKLSAGLGFAAASGQGSAVTGNDVSIAMKLASGAGLKFYSGKSGHYLAGGPAAAGSSFEIGLDGYLLGARSTKDAISVSIPVLDGLTASVEHAESGVSGAGTGAAATAGATTQRYNTLSLGYKAGGLVVDAGYRSYDLQIASTLTSATTKNRASVSYDLGVVKLGAGYDSTSYTAGNTYTETLAGVTVPMGNLTLGAQVGTVATAGWSTDYNFSGSLFGAKYDLSKRTYITAQYANYSGSFKASSAAVTTGTQNASSLYVSLYNTF